MGLLDRAFTTAAAVGRRATLAALDELQTRLAAPGPTRPEPATEAEDSAAEPALHPELARSMVLPDVRGDGRAMRVTWHTESGVVVLSVWRDNVCSATVRLPQSEVPTLIAGLSAGLRWPSDPGMTPGQTAG
jgi:hypothetical protein